MKRKRKVRQQDYKNKQSSTITIYKFIIHAFLVVVLGAFFFKIATPFISNTARILGISTFLAKGGDEAGGDHSGGEDDVSSSGNSSGGSSSGDSGSGARAVEPTKTENKTEKAEDSSIKIKTFTSESETKKNEAEASGSGETKTELKFGEGEKIVAKTKDGRTRIDITSGGTKTRLEIRDDRIIVKVEQENGIEVEVEENDALPEIEKKLDADDIKIATAGANVMLLTRGGVSATTSLPISIDFASNRLFIDTPSGQKEVAILPDGAVQNILFRGVLSRIGTATGSAQVGGTSGSIKIEERNGELVYKVRGTSRQRLFGLLPISINRTVNLSGKTGLVESTEESLLDRAVDLISF